MTLHVAGRNEIVNKKEKHGGRMRQWRVTGKKTMEGVAERRQQRKIFGGKKKSKIRCICC